MLIILVVEHGNVHTNRIENFWSHLKKLWLKATYVSVEPFHLFRNIDEQAFLDNVYKVEGGTRSDVALWLVMFLASG